jgi:hypothetical protein
LLFVLILRHCFKCQRREGLTRVFFLSSPQLHFASVKGLLMLISGYLALWLISFLASSDGIMKVRSLFRSHSHPRPHDAAVVGDLVAGHPQRHDLHVRGDHIRSLEGWQHPRHTLSLSYCSPCALAGHNDSGRRWPPRGAGTGEDRLAVTSPFHR